MEGFDGEMGEQGPTGDQGLSGDQGMQVRCSVYRTTSLYKYILFLTSIPCGSHCIIYIFQSQGDPGATGSTGPLGPPGLTGFRGPIGFKVSSC